MKSKKHLWITGALTTTVLIAGMLYWWSVDGGKAVPEIEEAKLDPIEMKKGRADYFFNLLRDPATNSIPDNIRSRELNHAKQVPGHGGGFLRKGQTDQQAADISWQSAGPADLGGRTRALAIDQRNPDIILAGGVSGGIWKSTDGGDTWEMKTDPNQNMSVTSLAQDPTDPDTWYYASGEYRGNSASDRSYSASYFGTGIYKSTDNGDSWSVIPSTEDTDNSFNSLYDYISRIKVSPQTGTIFAAGNASGVLRSTDGSSFSLVKGDVNEHAWVDFDIDPQGNIIAVLSSLGFETGTDPGVFYSTDDGESWIDVTPTDFPSDHERSVISFAPSAPDTAYAFTYEGTGSGANEDVSFFMLDLGNDDSEDRSDNLPDFGGWTGFMNTQSNYNMVVSVKPDDPDFVMVGGTNLFRSRDGFATTPSGGYDNNDSDQKDEYWIAGYTNSNDSYSHYQNQHPDQHVIVYNPGDPDEVWAGHDGGLSQTSDITASAVAWQDKNEGYVTGQFYTVAIPSVEDDNRILGGTQDNGTPFFRYDNDNGQQTDMLDVSSGDGAYAFWGTDYVYVSSQNGNVLRLKIESDGNLLSPYGESPYPEWSHVYPSGANNQLFIHPYEVDPNHETTMYYPGGRTMWRNTDIDEIDNYNQGGATTGWEDFEAVSSGLITALEVTNSDPSDRLYYAASGSGAPKIFSVDNASSSWDPVEVSISDAPDGTYMHDIAVNPDDGDELIVVMSNYNIVGLYHSTDGGSNWEAIEGNLEGDSQNPGPSLRNATILPTSSGTLYLVGTSTGVYSTTSLSGSNTEWTRESDDGSPESIGYSVAEYVVSRPSDGKIAVGSHGRGIFMGSAATAEKDPNDTTPPASPTGLEIASVDDDIQLTWDANTEDDLGRYRIYRGTNVDELDLYDSVSSSSTSFRDTDTEFETYFYQVTAVDVNENESDSSNSAAVVREYLAVDDQWRLVGTPLTESDAAELPDNTDLFSYNGAYQPASSFDTKNGFWVKRTSKDSIKYNGAAFTEASITLESGWNLIGGIADNISAADISDPDDILSSSPIFEYSGDSYDDADQIKPLTGYWIHAEQAGDIELSLSSESSSSSKERLADHRQSTDKIDFRQGNARQVFYLAEGSVKEDELDTFRMPPQAPSPTLDVRTSDGFRLAAGESTELELTTERYPVKVTLSEESSSDYALRGITDRDTVMYNLSPGEEQSIQRRQDEWYIVNGSSGQLITEHDLLPNYPNPFNPTTNIEYTIASQTHVSLAVYDVLGRRVRTLVNEVQEPGRYTKRFDAQDLSSGTYFIRIRAEDFSRVQQMTLIK